MIRVVLLLAFGVVLAIGALSAIQEIPRAEDARPEAVEPAPPLEADEVDGALIPEARLDAVAGVADVGPA